jgi:hypothetical protein
MASLANSFPFFKFSLSAAIMAAIGLTFSAALADEPTFVPLSELVGNLQNAIAAGRLESSQPPYFIIQKIGLRLQGETRLAANGGVTFTIPVFKAGTDLSAARDVTNSSTLEIELVPAKGTVVGGEQHINFSALIKSLKYTFSSVTGLLASAVTYT